MVNCQSEESVIILMRLPCLTDLYSLMSLLAVFRHTRIYISFVGVEVVACHHESARI